MPELKRPTITVPLYQGADYQRIEELRADLMEATSSTVTGPRLLSDTEPDGTQDLKAKAKAHDDFVREAEERAVKVVLEALPRRQWRTLEDAHPQRMVTKTVTGDDGTERTVEVPHEDDHRGFNFKTMADDLVPKSVPPTDQDGNVQFASEQERDAFLDNLSDPHFSALYDAAIRLNTEAGGVPKAVAGSLVEQIIAAISTSPEDSD